MTMNSHGVEISIAGGVGEMVRETKSIFGLDDDLYILL